MKKEVYGNSHRGGGRGGSKAGVRVCGFARDREPLAVRPRYRNGVRVFHVTRIAYRTVNITPYTPAPPRVGGKVTSIPGFRIPRNGKPKTALENVQKASRKKTIVEMGIQRRSTLLKGAVPVVRIVRTSVGTPRLIPENLAQNRNRTETGTNCPFAPPGSSSRVPPRARQHHVNPMQCRKGGALIAAIDQSCVVYGTYPTE